MARKILATDYDGTLSLDGIPPHVVEAIERFQAAGHLFGVVTGRDRYWSYEIFRKEGRFPFDFVLALNGALGLDKDGNELFTYPIDGTADCNGLPLAKVLPKRIVELSGDECGIAWSRERIQILPEYITADPDDSTVTPQGSLNDIYRKMNSFLMLNAVCPDVASTNKAVEILRREFGTWLNPLQNGRCIDIPVKGLDKGVGIARYAELMGIAKDDIWTAGDNLNDLAMLKPYHGCAMSTGTAEAKAVAEHVCDDIAAVISLIL